jgi:hypothetical protein
MNALAGLEAQRNVGAAGNYLAAPILFWELLEYQTPNLVRLWSRR